MTSELHARLESISQRLRRGYTLTVNDRRTRQQVIATAAAYFTEYRRGLASALGECEALLSHDKNWQGLIRMAHGRSSRKSYLDAIRRLQRELSEFSIECLTSASHETHDASEVSALSQAERIIITTLKDAVPSAAASYQQALLDLRAQRLSYRGTACELREAMRETLDHLAPDADVMAQPGFQCERDQTRPTMKQKVQYILGMRGRSKVQRIPTEKSAALIDSLAGEIARAVYNQSSLAVHVEASRAEVCTLKRYVDTIFYDLLEIPDVSPVAVGGATPHAIRGN
jgi:hypothetical protein